MIWCELHWIFWQLVERNASFSFEGNFECRKNLVSKSDHVCKSNHVSKVIMYPKVIICPNTIHTLRLDTLLSHLLTYSSHNNIVWRDSYHSTENSTSYRRLSRRPRKLVKDATSDKQGFVLQKVRVKVRFLIKNQPKIIELVAKREENVMTFHRQSCRSYVFIRLTSFVTKSPNGLNRKV